MSKHSDAFEIGWLGINDRINRKGYPINKVCGYLKLANSKQYTFWTFVGSPTIEFKRQSWDDFYSRNGHKLHIANLRRTGYREMSIEEYKLTKDNEFLDKLQNSLMVFILSE